ncbi:class I SAM-dependent methyltransferase [Ruminococcaceae bacterium OttesenSCG-928-L11]|nr:class I SAM-dependent methyltransferase [Ruminococcaceae bacterium OttesenSCG-928-L11]
MTPLDPRLAAAASLVREGAVTADIGTDHGYLICHLVASGRCPRGFACDINPLPLKQAEAHIAEYGLAGRIETVLTDGLAGLAQREIRDFTVLGMGGDLIGEIMTGPEWTRDPALHFVLQPMTKAEHLRRRLGETGFAIDREIAVESGRFVYTVLSVRYTGECREPDLRFAWTGLVWYNTDTASRRYLAAVADRLQKKAAGLAAGQNREEAAPYAALALEIRERMAEQHDHSGSIYEGDANHRPL